MDEHIVTTAKMKELAQMRRFDTSTVVDTDAGIAEIKR